NNEWIFSNGDVVQAWNEFNDIKFLFHSYPFYQFTLERFPNQNFFSRHFDTKSPPYGLSHRFTSLDSARIYIMDDDLTKIDRLNPSTYIKVIETAKKEKVIAAAMNNCFIWGKDSVVL